MARCNIENYRAKQSAAVANGELKQTEQKQNKNNHAAQEHKTSGGNFMFSVANYKQFTRL